MAEKFGIFEAVNHILLPDGNESDFEDGGEEKQKCSNLLKLILTRIILSQSSFEYICFFNQNN